MRIATVEHYSYGCDCGCCGHVVLVDGIETGDFNFGHPFGGDKKVFIERLVKKALALKVEYIPDCKEAGEGSELCIDFENSIVEDE